MEVGEPVAVPFEKPAPKGSIKGRFGKAEVKCGDPVALDAEATDIPDKRPTAFRIRWISRHRFIATILAPLKGGQIRGLEWISKKIFPGWKRPHVDFQVSAGGALATSDNQLNFFQFADFASYTKTIACVSGIYGWTGKFDLEFKTGLLNITVKIQLVNRLGPRPAPGAAMPAVGPALPAKEKQVMRRDIESKLSRKWILHREGCRRGVKCDCPKDMQCCKFQVAIHVQFVEAGPHHVVDLFQGAGQANAKKWQRVKTRPNSWAHETGHLLGWYDEYVGGANGTAPRWKAPNSGVIMSTGLKVPEEYYWDFRDEFKSKTGESWKLVR